MMTNRTGWLVVAAIVLASACNAREPVPERRDEAGDRVDRLRSLPYAATAGPADPERSGVTRAEVEGEGDDGHLFLYSSRRPPVAELIDRQGTVLRSWHDRRARYLVRARPLADGGLLWLGTEKLGPKVQAEDRARYLLRFDADGRVVWRVRRPFHHDVAVLPDGTLLALVFRYVDAPHISPADPVRDDLLVRLDGSGREIGSRSLLESLTSSPELFTPLEVAAKTIRGERYVDLIHANTVRWIDSGASRRSRGVFPEGSVLVTSRHQNAVFAIDWDSGRLLWAWGPGQLDGPHDAQVVERGRLLIFDNGLVRGWSRVIELDLRSRRIVWEYRADPLESFYTRSRGTCQRLAGGHTLVTESGKGRVFEVTPDGRVVWEYFNPHVDEASGERGTIGRMVMLDRELSARLAAGLREAR